MTGGDKFKDMAYVYRHIRLDKNAVFYIGIGSDDKYQRAYRKRRENKAYKRIGENAPMYGRKGELSPRFGIKGKNHQCSKKVKQVCLKTGNILEIFDCVKDAAIKYEVD